VIIVWLFNFNVGNPQQMEETKILILTVKQKWQEKHWGHCVFPELLHFSGATRVLHSALYQHDYPKDIISRNILCKFPEVQGESLRFWNRHRHLIFVNSALGVFQQDFYVLIFFFQISGMSNWNRREFVPLMQVCFILFEELSIKRRHSSDLWWGPFPSSKQKLDSNI
jgi:hypothetical protein